MNSFFGMGPMELFVILLITLIVLGPQRLPGTIREVMKYWRYFRNLSGELTAQLGEEFKDLEDLSPQRILEDLAKELDDEVEQTQDAAGIKKKPVAAKASPKAGAKSATTKSASASKSTTASKTPAKAPAAEKAGADTVKPETAETGAAQTETSQTDASQTVATVPDEASAKKSDATAAATASAAAAAAVSKGAVAPEDGGEATSVAFGADIAAGDIAAGDVVATGEAVSEFGEGESASMEAATLDGAAIEQPAQASATNGDEPPVVAEEEPVSEPVADLRALAEGEVENTILPPERAVVDESEDLGQAVATVQSQPEEIVLEIDAAADTLGDEEMDASPARTQDNALSSTQDDAPASTQDDAPSSTQEGEVLDETDGDGQLPIVKKTVGPVEPAPVSMNGKGVPPEDEG